MKYAGLFLQLDLMLSRVCVCVCVYILLSTPDLNLANFLEYDTSRNLIYFYRNTIYAAAWWYLNA